LCPTLTSFSSGKASRHDTYSFRGPLSLTSWRRPQRQMSGERGVFQYGPYCNLDDLVLAYMARARDAGTSHHRPGLEVVR